MIPRSNGWPFAVTTMTIVLAPCVRIIFAPAQLEALKVQFIESNKQVLRPLVAVAAFPQSVINEKIIEDWRAKHAVFSPEPLTVTYAQSASSFASL